MANNRSNSEDQRRIDVSRQADYDYGLRSGFSCRGHFSPLDAYQESKYWVYAEYWWPTHRTPEIHPRGKDR